MQWEFSNKTYYFIISHLRPIVNAKLGKIALGALFEFTHKTLFSAYFGLFLPFAFRLL
jgi:hypothetical protein